MRKFGNIIRDMTGENRLTEKQIDRVNHLNVNFSTTKKDYLNSPAKQFNEKRFTPIQQKPKNLIDKDNREIFFNIIDRYPNSIKVMEKVQHKKPIDIYITGKGVPRHKGYYTDGIYSWDKHGSLAMINVMNRPVVAGNTLFHEFRHAQQNRGMAPVHIHATHGKFDVTRAKVSDKEYDKWKKQPEEKDAEKYAQRQLKIGAKQARPPHKDEIIHEKHQTRFVINMEDGRQIDLRRPIPHTDHISKNDTSIYLTDRTRLGPGSAGYKIFDKDPAEKNRTEILASKDKKYYKDTSFYTYRQDNEKAGKTKIYIGGADKNVDFNKDSNINQLSQVIAHEELHHALTRQFGDKVGGKALDRISQPLVIDKKIPYTKTRKEVWRDVPAPAGMVLGPESRETFLDRLDTPGTGYNTPVISVNEIQKDFNLEALQSDEFSNDDRFNKVVNTPYGTTYSNPEGTQIHFPKISLAGGRTNPIWTTKEDVSYALEDLPPALSKNLKVVLTTPKQYHLQMAVEDIKSHEDNIARKEQEKQEYLKLWDNPAEGEAVWNAKQELTPKRSKIERKYLDKNPEQIMRGAKRDFESEKYDIAGRIGAEPIDPAKYSFEKGNRRKVVYLFPGNITNKDPKKRYDQLRETLHHEIGHQEERKVPIYSSKDTPFYKEGQKFYDNTAPTWYGTKNAMEDFAETFAIQQGPFKGHIREAHGPGTKPFEERIQTMKEHGVVTERYPTVRELTYTEDPKEGQMLSPKIYEDSDSEDKKLSESDIVTLWHGTTTEHAKQIMKEGLIPPTGQNPVWFSDKGGKTFLATTPHKALRYAVHGPERMRESIGEHGETLLPPITPKPYTPTLLKVTIPKNILTQTRGLFYGPTKDSDLAHIQKYGDRERELFESGTGSGEYATTQIIPPEYIKQIPFNKAKALIAKKDKGGTFLAEINRTIERNKKPDNTSYTKVPPIVGVDAPKDYTWNTKIYMHDPYPKADIKNIPIIDTDSQDRIPWHLLSKPAQVKAVEMGKKPVAMLGEGELEGVKTNLPFKTYSVSSGRTEPLTDYIFYRPETESRADKLIKLYTEQDNTQTPMDARFHEEVGKALGYKSKNIRKFNQSIIADKEIEDKNAKLYPIPKIAWEKSITEKRDRGLATRRPIFSPIDGKVYTNDGTYLTREEYLWQQRHMPEKRTRKRLDTLPPYPEAQLGDFPILDNISGDLRTWSPNKPSDKREGSITINTITNPKIDTSEFDLAIGSGPRAKVEALGDKIIKDRDLDKVYFIELAEGAHDPEPIRIYGPTDALKTGMETLIKGPNTKSEVLFRKGKRDITGTENLEPWENVNRDKDSNNMAMITGKDLPEQEHIGSTEFKDITPIGEKKYSLKPRGGFWTSSVTPSGKTAWKEWTEQNDYKQATDDQKIRIRPHADAKIFQIDNKKDMRDLHSMYPAESIQLGALGERKFIDWHKASQDLDALHVTDKGFWDNRENVENDLPDTYSWDAESTVWFKPKFDIITDKTSHNDNQVYLDPNKAPINDIFLKEVESQYAQHGLNFNKTDTTKYIRAQEKKRIVGEGKRHAAYVRPALYDKSTIIGTSSRKKFDFDNPHNINALAKTLEHEEIHQAIYELNNPKNMEEALTAQNISKQLDNITIPSILHPNEQEMAYPYSLGQIDVKAAKILRDKNVPAKDKLDLHEDMERKYIGIDKTSNSMAIKTNIPHWLLDKLPPEHHEEAKDLLLNKEWKSTQVAAKFGIEIPYSGKQRPRIYTTKEEKLAIIQQKAKDLGRTPISTDFDSPTEISKGAIKHEFGSFNEAIRQAGLTPTFERKNPIIPIPTEGTLPTEQERERIYNAAHVEDLQKKYDKTKKENPEYYAKHRKEVREAKLAAMTPEQKELFEKKSTATSLRQRDDKGRLIKKIEPEIDETSEGMAMITGKDLPPRQIHMGTTIVKDIGPIKGDRPSGKPVGAFYTSSLDPKTGKSSWQDWLSREQSYMSDESEKSKVYPEWANAEKGTVEIIPDPKAKIFELHTPEDWKTLQQQYPGSERSVLSTKNPTIAWPAVAKDFDAVHVTDTGAWSNRHGDIKDVPETYSWDVEQTAWFKPAFKIKEDRTETLKNVNRDNTSEDMANVLKVDKLKKYPTYYHSDPTYKQRYEGKYQNISLVDEDNPKKKLAVLQHDNLDKDTGQRPQKETLWISKWKSLDEGKGYGKELLQKVVEQNPEVTFIRPNGLTEQGKHNIQKALPQFKLVHNYMGYGNDGLLVRKDKWNKIVEGKENENDYDFNGEVYIPPIKGPKLMLYIKNEKETNDK